MNIVLLFGAVEIVIKCDCFIERRFVPTVEERGEGYSSNLRHVHRKNCRAKLCFLPSLNMQPRPEDACVHWIVQC
jgi:hypothetical protein